MIGVLWNFRYAKGDDFVGVKIVHMVLKATQFKDRKWTAYVRTIAVQIFAVMRGLKAGFLWDIGPRPAIEQVSSAIETVNNCFSVDQALLVVLLADEIFICRKQYEPVNCVLIDVSKSLKIPVIKENQTSLAQVLGDVQKTFQDNQLGSVVVNLNVQDFCIPTVMGLLIGYPILFWYDEDSNNENCLSGIELKVFQVSFLDKTVMSFSVPESLLNLQSIQEKIEEWEAKINSATSASITCFNKTLNVVIL